MLSSCRALQALKFSRQRGNVSLMLSDLLGDLTLGLAGDLFAQELLGAIQHRLHMMRLLNSRQSAEEFVLTGTRSCKVTLGFLQFIAGLANKRSLCFLHLVGCFSVGTQTFLIDAQGVLLFDGVGHGFVGFHQVIADGDGVFGIAEGELFRRLGQFLGGFDDVLHYDGSVEGGHSILHLLGLGGLADVAVLPLPVDGLDRAVEVAVLPGESVEFTLEDVLDSVEVEARFDSLLVDDLAGLLVDHLAVDQQFPVVCLGCELDELLLKAALVAQFDVTVGSLTHRLFSTDFLSAGADGVVVEPLGEARGFAVVLGIFVGVGVVTVFLALLEFIVLPVLHAHLLPGLRVKAALVVGDDVVDRTVGQQQADVIVRDADADRAGSVGEHLAQHERRFNGHAFNRVVVQRAVEVLRD